MLFQAREQPCPNTTRPSNGSEALLTIFVGQRYSRKHTWHFDGGAVVPGSSSPQVVRLPFSDPSAVDPEEAFVAALSSCHMLWFLDFARAPACRSTATATLRSEPWPLMRRQDGHERRDLASGRPTGANLRRDFAELQRLHHQAPRSLLLGQLR